MAEYSIGVDLGGTNLRAAAVSRDGKIIEKISGYHGSCTKVAMPSSPTWWTRSTG